MPDDITPTKIDRSKEWPILLKVAKSYKLDKKETIILLAIREVEKGGKGSEFGEIPAKGTNLETQAQWAAGGIKANKIRYNTFLTTGAYRGSRRRVYLQDFISSPDFIEFMAHYGGPTGFGRTPIHPKELTKKHIKENKNWVPNMRITVAKITEQFNEKGAFNNVKH